MTPPAASLDVAVVVPTTPSLQGLTIGAQLLALHDSSSIRLSNLVLETVRR